MKSGSLRFRLFLAGTVSVLAAMVLSAAGLTLLFERHVERRVVAELDIYLDQIIASLGTSPDGELALQQALADPRFTQPLSGLYWQVEAGDTVLRSRSLWDAKLVLPPGGPSDGEVRGLHIDGLKSRVLVAVERSVTLPDHLGAGTIRAVVASDAADIAAATRKFTADLLPYLALLGCVLIAASYVQVAVGLKPLAEVRKRIAAIRNGQARRLESGFPQEILPLASEVDALLDAREKQLVRARARAGDLAHGLKTPLQVLAGDVDRLRRQGLDGSADTIEQVLTAMQRHVDRELARARMATENANSRATVAEVIRRVVAVVSRTPDGARLEWEINVPAELTARIDADDMAEAVGNLVENAARHARGTISIEARRREGRIVVTVADDGPGMPDDMIEEAFIRGGLFDRTGSGAGLGLAIVRDIAEAWNGQIEIRTGKAGFTAEFTMQE